MVIIRIFISVLSDKLYDQLSPGNEHEVKKILKGIRDAEFREEVIKYAQST